MRLQCLHAHVCAIACADDAAGDITCCVYVRLYIGLAQVRHTCVNVRALSVGADCVWFGSQIFNYASAFNANIGAWNTASVTSMNSVCAAFGPADALGRGSAPIVIPFCRRGPRLVRLAGAPAGLRFQRKHRRVEHRFGVQHVLCTCVIVSLSVSAACTHTVVVSCCRYGRALHICSYEASSISWPNLYITTII
jgi:surface protein